MIPLHNTELVAVNVLEIDVDSEVIARMTPHLHTYRVSAVFNVAHPPWQSDIEWISPNTLTTGRFYRPRFEDLEAAQAVSPLLDLDQAPRLYCRFLWQRSHGSAPNFHEAWLDTLHQTFTLITPGQIGDPPA